MLENQHDVDLPGSGGQMIATKQDVKSPTQTLTDERNRLTVQLTELQNKIRGLELAIDLINDQADRTASFSGPRAIGTSAVIREILVEAGSAGITPQMAIERAAARGETLNKTSVSSLLSRMKRDGEVVYVARRYVWRPAV